ncbi:MAG: DUF192 domain-containing protein [Alphaproteobacteria bacterium]|nr:DUF192 domain-containing protein [Alphaproteobacteria bacterium]
MRRTLLYFILILLLAGLASTLPPAKGAEGQRLPVGPLVVENERGRHQFRVELAANEDQRSRGLMFRREMAADAGMLFDFHVAQLVAFWMKDTFIPLDMIFIKENGRVAGVAKRTVPHSTATVPSPEPVRAVLEVNAGVSDRLGIKAGDLVRHNIFGNMR